MKPSILWSLITSFYFFEGIGLIQKTLFSLYNQNNQKFKKNELQRFDLFDKFCS